MKLRLNVKRILTIIADILLGIYLVMAITAFNKPDDTKTLCTGVDISIADESTNGFITRQEIENRLKASKLYPKDKKMRYVDTRKIEEMLRTSPFVKNAECYKSQDGRVCITLTQRMPIVRIKAQNGEDYYLDDQDSIMPNSQYTSDLIIATGHITRSYAIHYIAPLAKTVMNNALWSSQIEQINVLSDQFVEIVPRVGNHIIGLGTLPSTPTLISPFVEKKMNRLFKFYKYGLSEAGWNKYKYINLEFDNQIICKRRGEKEELPVVEAEEPVPAGDTPSVRN